MCIVKSLNIELLTAKVYKRVRKDIEYSSLKIKFTNLKRGFQFSLNGLMDNFILD